jgi:CheY-like chemotaxis protein
MGRAASTLLGIVNDILDFSKAEAGRMTLERIPLDVRRVFADIAACFQEQSSRSGITLRLDLDPAIPPVLLGDPLRLYQIFVNLADNAFKFTEKGAVTVRAAVSGRSGRDVTLDFAVEDTGIGMSREQTEGIFSAFSQADSSFTRKYGGAGLGLTIARGMVELMGGKIAVSSEEGKGAIFSFSCVFPLPEEGDDASGALKEAAEDDDENAVLRGMRVLLVEDNEVNSLIADELMSAVGIAVTTAENGEEALKRLAEAPRTGGAPFDAVLMDLQMPVMDGYDATERILGNPEYRGMPIFAMTAHAYSEEKERALAAGMKGHLTKPVDVKILYQTLREVAASRAAAA